MMIEEKTLRIQRYLARSGMGSRRACERYLEEGRIKVNGAVVVEPGSKVFPGDEVLLDGDKVELNVLRYFIINKPKGYISVNLDQKGRKWVVDIIPGGREMGLFPVGRLDLDTSGLMVLTNDGEIGNRISHPRFGVMKEYRALIKGIWTNTQLKDEIENGIVLENGDLVNDVIAHSAVNKEGRTIAVIRIHEGRKHVIRRIFQAIGTRVLELERTKIGGLELSGIPPGGYIEVSREEIEKAFNYQE